MVHNMGKPEKVTTPLNQEAARLLREAFDAKPEINRAMLAEISGEPEGTLAKVLNGTAPVRVEQFLTICLALKADPAQMMTRLERFYEGERLAED